MSWNANASKKGVMGTLCYSTVPGIYASNRSKTRFVY